MVKPILAVTPKFDGGRRYVGPITVRRTIAMIHGADERLLPSRFVLAPPALWAAIAIASTATVRIPGGEPVLAGFGPGRLLCGHGLSGLVVLTVSLAFAGCIGEPFASTAPPAMLPLRLRGSRCRLSLRRLGLRLGLRLILLCCHACTSWRIVYSWRLKPPLPFAIGEAELGCDP